MTDEQLLRALHPSPETAWPRWWLTSLEVSICDACGAEDSCEREYLGYGEYREFCGGCNASFYGDEGRHDVTEEYTPATYVGPPLLSPTASLDALLEVADKVAWLGVDIVWVNSQMLFACRFSDRAGELYVGTGTTRREAVQDALLAAAKGGDK